jgi:hypothetical protein
MCAYTFGVGIAEALHRVDWQGGLFFEVPAIIASRILWTKVKIGTDGIEASDDATDAIRDLEEAVDKTIRETQSLSNGEPPVPQKDTTEVSLSRDTLATGDQSNRGREVDDARSFQNERDPVLLFARLRVDIEQALRRMARLAALARANGPFMNANSLVRILRRYDLINAELGAALARVLSVANAALHGDLAANHSEEAEIAELGVRALNGLRRLTALNTWIGEAIAVRAGVMGQQVETRSKIDGTGSLRVNGIRVLVAANSSISLVHEPGVFSVLPEEADAYVIDKLTERGIPFAWVSGDGFRGNVLALEAAPWLFAS